MAPRMPATVQLRLTRDEAATLRAILGTLPVTAPSECLTVADDVWTRLGHLLQPTRARVRRADRPREPGHHALY